MAKRVVAQNKIIADKSAVVGNETGSAAATKIVVNEGSVVGSETDRAAAAEIVANENPVAGKETDSAAATEVRSVISHRIAAVVAKGFFRAGRYWPREGVEINQYEFSETQWATLVAEPMLIVTAL